VGGGRWAQEQHQVGASPGTPLQGGLWEVPRALIRMQVLARAWKRGLVWCSHLGSFDKVVVGEVLRPAALCDDHGAQMLEGRYSGVEVIRE
jgi:hypothetical protein